VVLNRVWKQVSAEGTFPKDIPLVECETHIRRLAEKVWNASKDNARQGGMVVLKLKTKEFSSITRSLTPRTPIFSRENLTNIALALRERADLPPEQLFRRVGMGLSNFQF
jgi:DNA polymerase IV